MWWLVLGLVAAMVLIAVVINRRGSTGASRADDLPSGRDGRAPDPGFGSVGGIGGGGDAGGGGF